MPLLGLEKTNLELETPHDGIVNTSGILPSFNMRRCGLEGRERVNMSVIERERMKGERPQGSPAPHVLTLKFEIVECGFSWDSKKQR